MIEIRDPNERRIGPYSVVGSLAHGATSEVVKAIDSELNRTVAIKLLSPEFMKDDEARARFDRESRTVTQLDHPNVARIFEAGVTQEGQPYLVMEFVDGVSLIDLIRNKVELPFSTQIDLIIQAAEGLRAALAQGIIHRDIKPANLMVDREYRAKVVDFGLAKVIREDAYKSVAGRLMGTPRYMSPEIALGRTGDYRSDIYSLGGTFYHLLTAQPPFDGETPAAVMLQHVNSPLTPPYMLNPQIPADISEIVDKAMAKDPNHRYQDYDELLDDLKEAKMARMAKEQAKDAVITPDEQRLAEAEADLGEEAEPAEPRPVAAAAVVGEDQLTGEAFPDAPARPPSYTSEGRITVSSEPPPEPPPQRKFSGRLLVLIAVLLAVIGGLSYLTRPEEAGGAGSLSNLINTLLIRLNIKEVEETLGERLMREYRTTENRLTLLSAAASEHLAVKGRHIASLQELVDAGFAQAGDLTDGYGELVRYERPTRKIRSAGPDRTMDSIDDFVIDETGRFVQKASKPDLMDEQQFTGVERRPRKAETN